jgi:hypothetical protein
MRTLKAFLVLAATAVLLAGCATGEGGDNDPWTHGAGPNGFISPANPFGLGTGPGMSR